MDNSPENPATEIDAEVSLDGRQKLLLRLLWEQGLLTPWLEDLSKHLPDDAQPEQGPASPDPQPTQEPE